jgi:hypothetical protein
LRGSGDYGENVLGLAEAERKERTHDFPILTCRKASLPSQLLSVFDVESGKKLWRSNQALSWKDESRLSDCGCAQKDDEIA